ncbi:CRISPR-associated protein, Csn2 family [Tissierellia bacterium KA00581]|nr:CRISPR-associated protein, Csn2 family [Tissierellia bacterium KA00581]
MKLQLKNFNFNVDLDDKINTIIIENTIEYRKIVNSFINELNVKDGNILLSKDIELLMPDKYLFTFYDYFSFDINKYALNKFYKKLKEISMLEYLPETSNLKNKIEEYVYKITKEYDLYLDISCDLDIIEILKSLNVKIKQYDKLSLDKIINYMNIISEIFNIKHFVFISLKNYFTEKEILDFYKYIIYNEFNVVLVEPNNVKTIQTKEKTYIIDKDLCEIY